MSILAARSREHLLRVSTFWRDALRFAALDPRAFRHPDHVEAYADLVAKITALMRPGGFTTITADPPWLYDDNGSRLSPDYDRFPPAAAAALPVGELAARDAILHLWTPNALLEEGFMVARAWGFEPKTNTAWGKIARTKDADGETRVRFGGGHYTRGAHKVAILAVRGRVERLDAGVPSFFIAPRPAPPPGQRKTHSAKPVDFHRLVERLTSGPRLELFAREARIGWTTFGDQIARGRRAAEDAPDEAHGTSHDRLGEQDAAAD